jgi:putative nucleotidyltransferase with HDIG domain
MIPQYFKKSNVTSYILVSITNATHFSQKGFRMGTQPLLQENTPDKRKIVHASLQLESFQGLVDSLIKPGQQQSNFYQLPQNTPIAQEYVEYKTVQEFSLFNNLREEFTEIFSSLTPMLKAKDPQLYQHSLRVHSLALPFATTSLQLSEAESLKIGLAAFFHDIGKLNIHNAILQKASGLSQQEYEIIKNHPAYGAEILSHFKLINSVIPAMYHHHERFDGEGYPDGLRGNAIPFEARIIAIVDAFEVMTSQRNYQKSRTSLQAIEELYEHAGTQFDAELVALFCKFLEKYPQM